MYKRTTVYLNTDLTIGIEDCGIRNLSDFFNHCLEETILLNNPDFSPGKQAKLVAERLRKDILAQRKIVEEQRSFQEQAEEMHEKFKSEASRFFQNIESFKEKLPEYDLHGDYESFWNRYAANLSKICGFTVTVNECFSFIRAETSCGGFDS